MRPFIGERLFFRVNTASNPDFIKKSCACVGDTQWHPDSLIWRRLRDYAKVNETKKSRRKLVSDGKLITRDDD